MSAFEYSGTQLDLMSIGLRDFLDGDWLEDRQEDDEQRPMLRLLLAVYVAYRSGRSLTKREVADEMGVEHYITARKYIDRGCKEKLLRVGQARDDRRKDLVYPTARGLQVANAQLSQFANRIRELAHALLVEPLPSTGTPALARVEGDLTDNWVVEILDARRLDVLGTEQYDVWEKEGEPAVFFEPEIKRPKAELDKQIGEFTETIRLTPDNAMAYISRGRCYFQLSEFGKAIDDWTNAIRLDWGLALPYGLRGYAYLLLDDYVAASNDLERCVRLAPKEPRAHLYFGMALEKKGEAQQAKVQYAKALECRPSLQEARAALERLGS